MMPPTRLPQQSKGGFGAALTGFLLLCAGMAAIGNIGKSTFLFSILYLSAFLCLFFLVRLFPQQWSTRQQWLVLLGVSLLARFIFLDFPASGDTCRYIWEGAMLNKGYDPFVHAPDSPLLAPFVEELHDIWQDVNHKDATGCYPPLAMLIFRAAAFVAPTRNFFNLIILLFDLATVWLVMLILRERRRPLSHVLLFALNPLVLVYLAGESHLDAIQNFFLWLGIYFLLRQKQRPGFIALGCAIMSKYFSILCVPFLLKKSSWKALALLPVTMFLFYLPFWETGRRFFTSLKPFGLRLHYNDSLTVYLRAWFGAYAVPVSLALFACCLLLIFLLMHDPLKSCYLAIACLLPLLSTLHPWYLTLLTPFLVFFPSRAWLLLHAAAVFTFPVMHYEYYSGVFQEIHWLKWCEYVPFYGLLLWDAFTNRPYFSDRCFAPVKNLSVVIPALNESQKIARCLKTVCHEPNVLEIILVDGGSTDDTCAIAQRLGAKVLTSDKGRGHQIQVGVQEAQGDVVLILHADCLLERGLPQRILTLFNRQPQMIGGAVGMRYEHRPVASRLVEWLNNRRARWSAIAFGDQAQFFRREALNIFGGMPDQMLMEDVELSLRLKEHGPVGFVTRGVTVSNRRWQRQGFCANFFQVIRLCLTYLIQRRLGLGDARRQIFYERYYAN